MMIWPAGNGAVSAGSVVKSAVKAVPSTDSAFHGQCLPEAVSSRSSAFQKQRDYCTQKEPAGLLGERGTVSPAGNKTLAGRDSAARGLCVN